MPFSSDIDNATSRTTVGLLSLHGANRAPPNPANWTAEGVAEHYSHAALLAWVRRTRDFTPAAMIVE